MQIDIRDKVSDKVTEILFWDKSLEDAHKIVLNDVDTTIADGGEEVYIRSVQHAEYLIKALEKAIELGTWS